MDPIWKASYAKSDQVFFYHMLSETSRHHRVLVCKGLNNIISVVSIAGSMFKVHKAQDMCILCPITCPVIGILIANVIMF